MTSRTVFRPCIDLHSGSVKQIVGSTLTDEGAAENFVSEKPAEFYADLYKQDGLKGGHVIMLGQGNTEPAKAALATYPGGLQVGGGVNSSNCKDWIDAGASHVIVTSYVFKDGTVNLDRLQELVDKVGKDKLVLDLSCRRKPEDPNGPYYVVTDRWQKYTDYAVTPESLTELSKFCSEFLVHGVENEGKRCGILEDLVSMLASASPIPVTYAGGASCIEDLERVQVLSGGRVDLTIGSALDCFGGDVSYDAVVAWSKANASGRE